MTVKQITVLGATGSIGTSTLDVIAQHPDRYRLYAASGVSRLRELAEIAERFRPAVLVVNAQQDVDRLSELLTPTVRSSVEILWGEDGLCRIASEPCVDLVMAAIVGAAGLAPTWAAASAGKTVLLANKEVLVTAGGLFMQRVAHCGARLLPIDSEHNAIFQCLPENYAGSLSRAGIRKIHLTASGGPFRHTALDDLYAVTPAQAVAHPNWSMGQKISVDSASLMNKGLELIEACWLFGCGVDDIDIVVHPQSIIHSMVEYVDGSILAQLGAPDMRTPIAHAMAWPERTTSGVAGLDFKQLAQLEFFEPDCVRFPCLRLAIEAARVRGYAPIYLNAANEVSVEAFLQGRIGFMDIARVNESVMQKAVSGEPSSIDVVKQADCDARRWALEIIG